MLTIQSTLAPDDYVLAEDFLSLDHWETHGVSDADHRLAPEMSLGYGGSFYVPEQGNTRIARPTMLVPGESYVVSWRVHPDSGNEVGPRLQFSNGRDISSTVDSENLTATGLLPGWNHVIALMTVPAAWGEVWLRVQKTASIGGPGYLHRIRANRAPDEGEGR